MKYLYKDKYWMINKKYNINKLLYLMVDRPNNINIYGYFWNRKGQLYRDYNLPSTVYYFNDEDCILYWW